MHLRVRPVPIAACVVALVLSGGCGAGSTRPQASMGPSATLHDSSHNLTPDEDTSWMPDLDALNDRVPTERGPAGTAEAGATLRGEKVTGAGYAWTAPAGWADIAAELTREGMPADSAMAGPEAHGVRENVTVTVLDHETLDAYENDAHTDLAYLSDHIRVEDRIEIDGLDAAHARAEANTGGSDFIFEQYAVLHDGTMYALSFTISPDRSLNERQALITEVLASWQWNTVTDEGDR